MTVQTRQAGERNVIDALSRRVNICSTQAEMVAVSAQLRADATAQTNESVWVVLADAKVWVYRPASTTAAVVNAVLIPTDNPPAGRFEISRNQQSGTHTLGAGGTVAVATARITATSRVLVSFKAAGAGAITGFGALEVTAITVGAPGSFTVTAIDDAKVAIATARCSFDWSIIDD